MANAEGTNKARGNAAFLAAAAVSTPTLIIGGNACVGLSAFPLALGQHVPTLGMLAGLFLLLLAAMVAAAATKRRPWPVRSLAVAGSLLAAGALVVGSFVTGVKLRLAGFETVARDLQPVVEALHAHQRAHGHPAADLQTISAEASIPPRYGTALQYMRPNETDDLHGKDWALMIHAGWGFGFDRFVYFSDAAYPDRLYGGRPIRVGAWAYVYE